MQLDHLHDELWGGNGVEPRLGALARPSASLRLIAAPVQVIAAHLSFLLMASMTPAVLHAQPGLGASPLRLQMEFRANQIAERYASEMGVRERPRIIFSTEPLPRTSVFDSDPQHRNAWYAASTPVRRKTPDDVVRLAEQAARHRARPTGEPSPMACSPSGPGGSPHLEEINVPDLPGGAIVQCQGHLEYCFIRPYPAGVRYMGSVDFEEVLAHEVFHCMQMQMMSIEHYLAGVSWNWVKEGSAMWALQQLLGDTPLARQHWLTWFQDPRSMAISPYSAVGFFTELNSRLGGGLWLALRSIITARDGAFARAHQLGGDQLLQNVAMGIAREPALGPSWNIQGGGIPPIVADVPGRGAQSFQRRAPSLTIGATYREATQALEPLSRHQLDLNLSNGVIAHLRVAGFGGLQHLGRSPPETDAFAGSFDRQICYGEACRCPNGTMPEGVQGTESPTLRLAVATAAQVGSIQIGVVQSRRCPTQVGCANSTSVDSCLVGTWRQTGGGAVEWMRRELAGRSPEIDVRPPNDVPLTFRPDGTFSAPPLATSDFMGYNSRRGNAQARGVSQSQSSGTWSASKGFVALCAAQQEWRTAGTIQKDRKTTPYSAAISGAADPMQMSYSCSENQLETRLEIQGSRHPMTTIYSKIRP